MEVTAYPARKRRSWITFLIVLIAMLVPLTFYYFEYQATHPHTVTIAAALPDANYVLRAARFRSLQDAETLKGQLLTLGFPAYHQQERLAQKVVYSVFIGPYGDEKGAQSAQENLNKNHLISTKLLKIVARNRQ